MNEIQKQVCKSMAQAVLEDDFIGARQLADYLVEHDNPTRLPPVAQIKVNRKRLRVALFTLESLGSDVIINKDGTEQAIRDWLDGDRPLMLAGMRMELYELPEGF